MALQVSKVLISDKIDPCCKELFEKNSIAVDYKPGLNKDELKSIISGYDALIVRSATKVTEEVIDCAKRLKIVGRAGTGVDNIDQKAASRNGILVMNTPGGNTLSAAEHTCAMISALARNIGQGHAALKEGKWEMRSKLMGCELMGKTLAIVGLGKIGKEVAIRMQSYGMRTIGFDPLVSADEAAKSNIEYMSLDEMWPLADFITLHVPLIPPTKGMINTKVFNVCKPTIKVVNVARGGIIDETDLLTALDAGTCSGAALDVFASEPPKDISLKLVQHPKVLCTPHLGASTTEAQKRVAKEIAEQIIDGVNGRPMVGLVNAPALSEAGNPSYKSWISVAEKLGVIYGQLHAENKVVELVVSGECLSSAGRLMVAAYSCGLAKTFNESANFINASSILLEKGFKVTQRHQTGNPSISLVLNDATVFQGEVSNEKPVLVKYDGVALINPIVLTQNLIVGCASDVTELKKSLLSTNVTSFTVGCNGDSSNCVVVGAINEVVDEALKTPLKFIALQ